MPSFQPNDEHRFTAKKLTEFFRGQFRQRDLSSRSWSNLAEQAGSNAPLRDVVKQIQTFSRDFELAREFGFNMPMAGIPKVGLIPILSTPSYEGFYPFVGRQKLLERLFFRAALEMWPEEEIEFVPPDAAQENFFDALGRFLEFRIAGFDFWRKNPDQVSGAGFNKPAGDGSGPTHPSSTGGPTPSPGGLTVTLSCNNRHLRALASTAIGVRWHYFGAPTYPVTGILLPGIWLFAADGGVLGSSIVVDRVPVQIPPNLTPCATAF